MVLLAPLVVVLALVALVLVLLLVPQVPLAGLAPWRSQVLPLASPASRQ